MSDSKYTYTTTDLEEMKAQGPDPAIAEGVRTLQQQHLDQHYTPRLTWTTERPTVPGLYHCTRGRVGVMRVFWQGVGHGGVDYKGRPVRVLIADLGDAWELVFSTYFDNAKWAGPIPEPEGL